MIPCEFEPLGDSALIIRFTDTIDDCVNQHIHFLCVKIEESAIAGIIECVPTFTCLSIIYDPVKWSFTELKLFLINFLDELGNSDREIEKGEMVIPVCYGEEFGPDIDFVAIHNHCTVDEVIKIHSSTVYRVYMLGFIPGFAHLGSVDHRITTPRRSSPRLKVESGSVGIANRQTGIYPYASPGGWQLIGRTPLLLFDETKSPPSYLNPGDVVRFLSIGKDEFYRLREEKL